MLGNFYIANSKVGAQARLKAPAPETLVAVSALRDLGASITQPKRQALNTFLKGEIEAGRWDKVKRFYLPVWGLAGPNALCLKTLTSGTFVGGVTHGAGFVQGDGSTGYFNTGTTPASVGITKDSASLFALVYQAGALNSKTMIGGSTIGNSFRINRSSTATVTVATLGGTANANMSVVAQDGVYFADRAASNSLISTQRKTSSLLQSNVNTTNITSVMSTTVCAMGNGTSTTPSELIDAKMGAFGFGLSMGGLVGATAASLSLKTLWETCTGLTLP